MITGCRIAFLNLAAGIEHQHSARQALDQRRQTGGQMLFTRVRFAQFRAQPCDLRTQ
jgi:hypothetical protein